MTYATECQCYIDTIHTADIAIDTLPSDIKDWLWSLPRFIKDQSIRVYVNAQRANNDVIHQCNTTEFIFLFYTAPRTSNTHWRVQNHHITTHMRATQARNTATWVAQNMLFWKLLSYEISEKYSIWIKPKDITVIMETKSHTCFVRVNATVSICHFTDSNTEFSAIFYITESLLTFSYHYYYLNSRWR